MPARFAVAPDSGRRRFASERERFAVAVQRRSWHRTRRVERSRRSEAGATARGVRPSEDWTRVRPFGVCRRSSMGFVTDSYGDKRRASDAASRAHVSRTPMYRGLLSPTSRRPSRTVRRHPTRSRALVCRVMGPLAGKQSAESPDTELRPTRRTHLPLRGNRQRIGTRTSSPSAERAPNSRNLHTSRAQHVARPSGRAALVFARGRNFRGFAALTALTVPARRAISGVHANPRNGPGRWRRAAARSPHA